MIDLTDIDPPGEPAWPPFHRSAGNVAALARYVSPQQVASLGLGDGLAYTNRESHGTVHGNKQTVIDLYERLRRRGYRYAVEPYHLDEGQQLIRHPDELDRDAGTCVDLTVLAASQLLADRVAPIIVVGTTRGGVEHAWLLADLARDPEGLARPAGGRVADALAAADGDLHLTDDLRTALTRGEDAERWLPLDVTQATVSAAAGGVSERPVSEAIIEGHRLLKTAADVHLVDVAVRHRLGNSPHRGLAPHERPAIGRLLPDSPRFDDLGAERAAALRTLKEKAGILAVVGEPALGKSMLALQAAATAAGGCGWFLAASSDHALRADLAAAEAHQRFGAADGLTDAQLPELAHAAKERLEASTAPWVVVLDNANLTAPSTADAEAQLDAILRLAPRPRPEHLQKVIVTTTSSLWSKRPGIVPVPLGPVELGLPRALRAGGRPLFRRAFDRLAAALDDDVAGLAERVTSLGLTGDAADLLWRLVVEQEGGEHGTDVLRLARAAAWSTPDSVEARRLAETLGLDPTTSTAALDDLGLLEPSGRGRGRMHRLIGAAIREESLVSDRVAVVAAVLAALDGELRIDLETFGVIKKTLQELDVPDVASNAHGCALHQLGMRAEELGRVPVSHELMEQALGLLDSDEHRRRADAHHMCARWRFQSRKSEMAQARRDIDAALHHREIALSATVPGTPEHLQRYIEQQRSIALLGLITVTEASRLSGTSRSADSRRAAVEQIEQGRRLVDESLAARESLLPADDPDILRGRFNQANTALTLAGHCTGYTDKIAEFDRAFHLYRSVGDARDRMRPKAPSVHIASCWSGMALARYYRSLTPDPDADRRRDRDRRSADLREAGHHLQRALALREGVEDLDHSEVEKTLRVEVKIATARFLLATARTGNTALVNDLRRDLTTELSDLRHDLVTVLGDLLAVDEQAT